MHLVSCAVSYTSFLTHLKLGLGKEQTVLGHTIPGSFPERRAFSMGWPVILSPGVSCTLHSHQQYQ